MLHPDLSGCLLVSIIIFRHVRTVILKGECFKVSGYLVFEPKTTDSDLGELSLYCIRVGCCIAQLVKQIICLYLWRLEV